VINFFKELILGGWFGRFYNLSVWVAGAINGVGFFGFTRV
jgi:hypothetical protein